MYFDVIVLMSNFYIFKLFFFIQIIWYQNVVEIQNLY